MKLHQDLHSWGGGWGGRGERSEESFGLFARPDCNLVVSHKVVHPSRDPDQLIPETWIIFTLLPQKNNRWKIKKKVQTNGSPPTRAIAPHCLSAVACCRGNYLLISQCRFSLSTQGKVSPSHQRLTGGLGAAGMCPRAPGLLTCSRGPAHATPPLIGNSGNGGNGCATSC